jgi:hypothetical protein
LKNEATQLAHFQQASKKPGAIGTAWVRFAQFRFACEKELAG